MKHIKTCLICCKELSVCYFNDQYDFCQFCQKKLVDFKKTTYSAINSSLKYGIQSYIWKFLPYTVENLKRHIEWQFESWMTWNNRGRYKVGEWNDEDISTWRWQLDHIIPQNCFWFTSVKDELFQKCWALDNIRPLSAKMNYQKGHKIIW